jgi:hypothetical protein
VTWATDEQVNATTDALRATLAGVTVAACPTLAEYALAVAMVAIDVAERWEVVFPMAPPQGGR